MPPLPPAPPVAATAAVAAETHDEPVLPPFEDQAEAPAEAITLPEAIADIAPETEAEAEAEAAESAEAERADEEFDEDFDLTIVSTRHPRRIIWALIDDAGNRTELDSVAVVGRKPTRPATIDVAQLVPLADPGRMMSKTHALIETDEDSAWITDLGSTNGTALLQNGQGVEFAPNERTPVQPGARLQLGGLQVQLNREES